MATKTVNTRIQLNRRNKEDWTGFTPLAGELCFELDTKRFKFGDGVNDYEDLPYAGGVLSTGTGAPTSETAGELGQFYINTTDNSVYQLVAIADGGNVWKKLVFAGDKVSEAVLADVAKKLQEARTIGLTGDASGSASFDGSANASISVTLADTSVVAGTYPKVTVDSKGRVTAGASLAVGDIPTLTMDKISDAGDLATKDTISNDDIAANAAIAKSKLASDVQASLGLADSALQSHQTVTLASGTNNGTLKITTAAGEVDNIAVKGLGSAAYTDSTDYATAAQGAKADTALQSDDIANMVTHSGAVGSATTPVYITSEGVATAGTALGTMAYETAGDYTKTSGLKALAFKDAIADADVAASADIAQSKIKDLTTDLSLKANASSVYTKTEVDQKIAEVSGGAFQYKGSVHTYAELPTTGNKKGDVWNVEQADSEHGIRAGDNVAWDGAKWDVLAGTVDLSGYLEKVNVTSKGSATSPVYFTSDGVATEITSLPAAKVTGLATVATSGSYSDLNDLPTLGDLAAKDEVAESDLEATLAAKINGKADAATTLAGYGITDAYTKTEANSAFVEANTAITATSTANYLVKYDTQGLVTGGVAAGSLAKLDEVDESNLATALATKINGKADASSVYTKTEADGTFVKQTTKINNQALTGDVTLTTTNIAEGNNLYYTQDRFNTAFAAKASTGLTDTADILYKDDVLILDGGSASSQNI